MSAQVRSINCTNCGAGLEVIGGGRVTTKVCGYCGAALDANDAWRVLEVWDGMERPRSPFRLGMRGAIGGAEFTVIGTLGQRERDGGRTWDWVDHQLYSPTHGYAWLTVDDGHAEFTRKVRDWPQGPYVDTRLVESAESPPSRSWRGRTFRYYESGGWTTTYVEGEFNFRPARGAHGRAVALLTLDTPSRMLSFVETVAGPNRGEREVEVSRYCAEAFAAFGVEPPVAGGRHPMLPFAPVSGRKLDRAFFGALAGASLLLALYLTLGGTPAQTLHEGRPDAVPATLAFEVRETSRPVRIDLGQDVSNDFAVYDVALTGPDGATIAETGREISYYHGGAGEDAWTEGSRTADLGFAPEATGTHRLALRRDAGAGTGGGTLTVRVAQGRTNPLWIGLCVPLFGLIFAVLSSGRLRHRMARWRGSDWSED